MKIGELLETLTKSEVHTHITVCKDEQDILTFSSDSKDAVELVKDLEVKDWFPIEETTVPSIVIDLPDTVTEEEDNGDAGNTDEDNEADTSDTDSDSGATSDDNSASGDDTSDSSTENDGDGN